MEESLINTHGEITGAKYLLFVWDWDMEDYVEGYDKEYSIFCYEYESAQLQKHQEYLKSVGFEYVGPDARENGMTYYKNYYNDYVATIAIPSDDEWVLIEITQGKNLMLLKEKGAVSLVRQSLFLLAVWGNAAKKR